MRTLIGLTALLTLAACGDPDQDETETEVTEDVTYADVAPILEANCTNCHGDTPSNGAPSTLSTYETASPKADAIVNRAVDGTPSAMPPGGLVLTDAEADTLTAWADAGAPE